MGICRRCFAPTSSHLVPRRLPIPQRGRVLWEWISASYLQAQRHASILPNYNKTQHWIANLGFRNFPYIPFDDARVFHLSCLFFSGILFLQFFSVPQVSRHSRITTKLNYSIVATNQRWPISMVRDWPGCPTVPSRAVFPFPDVGYRRCGPAALPLWLSYGEVTEPPHTPFKSGGRQYNAPRNIAKWRKRDLKRYSMVGKSNWTPPIIPIGLIQPQLWLPTRNSLGGLYTCYLNVRNSQFGVRVEPASSSTGDRPT